MVSGMIRYSRLLCAALVIVASVPLALAQDTGVNGGLALQQAMRGAEFQRAITTGIAQLSDRIRFCIESRAAQDTAAPTLFNDCGLADDAPQDAVLAAIWLAGEHPGNAWTDAHCRPLVGGYECGDRGESVRFHR